MQHEQLARQIPQGNSGNPSVPASKGEAEAWHSSLSLPILNHFRYEELLPDLYFASVESGDWSFLSWAEFDIIKNGGEIPPQLRNRLERAYLLLDRNNIDEYCRRLASRYFFLDEGPTLHILIVTHRCNLDCIYCQAAETRNRKGDMRIETAQKAVDRALETPARSIILEFQGGEPLLNFSAIQAAILHAEERGRSLGKEVQFNLVSNFTEVVNEEILCFLLDHGVSICISLDGPRHIHDRNRNHPGCYDTIRSNIQLYHKVWRIIRDGPVVLHALLTTTRSSLDAVTEIVDTYLDCGIEHLSIRPLTPVGRGRGTGRDIQYTGSEFLTFWKRVVNEVIKRRKDRLDLRETHLELFLQKLFAMETGHMDIRSPCGAAIGQTVYDVDGDIFACDEGRMLQSDRFRIGNIASPLRNTLASLKAREILESSIAEQYYCDYCAFKPFCGVCPVLHYIEDKELVSNPLRQRRCSVYGGMIRHILCLFATDANARRVFSDIVETSCYVSQNLTLQVSDYRKTTSPTSC
jgi:uncharacterized protein